MTIKDLKVGMPCTILSSRKSFKHEETSIIRMIKKNNIFLEIIRIDGKLLNLSGVTNCLIFDQKNDYPQIFKYINPVITYDKKTKSYYYKINLKNVKSSKYNRRQHYRCYIGEEINVRADQNEKTYPCVLKDVSANGFALIFTGKNIPENFSDINSFHFVFNDFDPQYGFAAVLNLTGNIKRLVQLENNRILCGCSFPKSMKVEKYIAQKERLKQMKKMKKRG